MRWGRMLSWVIVVMFALTGADAFARTRHHVSSRHAAHRPAGRPHGHHRGHRHHAGGPHIARLHPVARTHLSAALTDLRRKGIRTQVTTAYRSNAEQRSLFRCARKRACRARRGIYAVAKPGRSMHEVGLAVDLAGVARGTSRRHRKLTRQGVQIVRVMRTHGFQWRYGLRDPAHFEISPRAGVVRTAKVGRAHLVRVSVRSSRNAMRRGRLGSRA